MDKIVWEQVYSRTTSRLEANNKCKHVKGSSKNIKNVGGISVTRTKWYYGAFYTAVWFPSMETRLKQKQLYLCAVSTYFHQIRRIRVIHQLERNFDISLTLKSHVIVLAWKSGSK